MSVSPVTVTVTGASGQIAYGMLFRIAAGDMLGLDVPVRLRLLEIPSAVSSAEGVAMELDDGAFPLLRSIDITDDPDTAFSGANVGMLVGARPRTKGMERADLLSANGAIFSVHGKAINNNAESDVKVLVVGNPANTNALIAMNNAPDVPGTRFTALTRLDHNRAIAQVVKKTGARASSVRKVSIWGNHSATQYPDLSRATVEGKSALEVINDREWVENDFIPTVQVRGTAIIAARGSSSAASAASASIDHIRDWVSGTADGDWVSMAVPSDGSYGVPEGLISSFPVTCADGDYSIVPGLEIDDFSRTRINISVNELEQERDSVRALGFV
ncbi:malate dehydrogenase [Rhodococcus sp. IEGM 1379]|uniref:malate dehydrogenase n=1 Tax=Rhodococcus sp. IEGM 1379 TaxID=3047086 RepID=UPI0024B7B38C|nr:malate dehydrogenase [Rhodococcus sp. IEGM 1379]MDI9915846.1 malate dehydrogenase [Rhodococcus sp. IEGM 1379]